MQQRSSARGALSMEKQMNQTARPPEGLLNILEQLLELPAVDLKTVLNQAVQLVHEALRAEKVDAFLFEPEKNSLRAMGTSDTPLGRLQVEQGLDVLPLANGGSVSQVYQTGKTHLTGHVDQVQGEVPGLITVLGIRSHIAVPLMVAGECRGVLSAQSTQPEFFSEQALSFLLVIARWVGALAHRAELVQATALQAHASGRRAVAEEMITVVAHDLRNYLSPLTYRVEMIRQRALEDERMDDLRDAEQAAQGLGRLSHLVTDLLDAERLERGILSMQPQPVELVAMAAEVARGLSTPDVIVHVQGPPNLPLLVDVSRIRQVLENLIGNAIKHSPRGGAVKVEMRTQIQAESAQRVAIVDVIDQGPGVSPEVLPRVFERFVSAGTSRGLGLGLYLASRIVSAHSGTLTVSSSPGLGARFQIVLPIEDASREPRGQADSIPEGIPEGIPEK